MDEAVQTNAPANALLFTLDEELRLVLGRASWIGTGAAEGQTVSFTSLLLGFLTSDDPLSAFAQKLAAELGPTAADILAWWKPDRGRPADFNAARLEMARSLSPQGLPVQELPVPIASMTPSASELLRQAASLVSELGPGKPVSGRHVLAAYLYRPPGHLNDYEEWKLDRPAWASRLFEHLERHHPDEVLAWMQLHARAFSLGPSLGVTAVQKWASGAAQAMSPPANQVDSRLLLAGVLLDGEAYRHRQVASAWLVKLVPSNPATLLELKAEPRPGVSSGLPYAPDAQAVLARAAVIASATGARKEFSVRHLIGALLWEPLAQGAVELLSKAGVHPRKLREGLVDWTQPWASPVETAGWRRLLATTDAMGVRFAGYDNDDPSGEDRLNINRDVQALAAVLASKQIAPPLSVGLFGDWGSGKSFFMRRLREHIQLLAESSRQATKARHPTSYCAEVIQIDFNAWHYMDGNLWASLVAHIFDQLNAQLSEQKKPTAEAYAAELESLAERRKELEAEKSGLANATARLQQEIDKHRAGRQTRPLSLTEIAAAILAGRNDATREQLANVAEQLGLDKAKMTLEEARVEKERLQHLAGQVAAWFRYVRTSPSRAVLALLFLALPVALAAIPNLLPGAMQWIASVIAAVPSVVWIASWIRSNTAPAVALIDKAFASAEEAEKLVRSRVSEEEKQLEAERAQLGAAEAKLEQERLSLVERQAAIEAELELLRQGRSFKRYVLERAASQDYRKQLGLIASVHRDFKALSERLGDEEEPHVERIVLYIDDLNRCPPDRVVEVLQALYLILSLPLFVVVVAVDSAWLLQSLEAYYARQFRRRSHWESKPQHYLEKIFQIPYALPPMEAAGFRNLVSGMLRWQIATQPAGPGTEPEKKTDQQEGNGQTTPPNPADRVQPPPPRAPEPIADLTPRNLQIEPKELQFVGTLAPLIPSPRSAKRLVNLYRIVRATLDSHELDRFLAGSGYQTTLLVLAAVVGCPSRAAELFEAIFVGRVQDARGLTTYLTQQYNADPSWGALAQLLGNRSELADWVAVQAAVRACARYSFETGRILRADSPTPAAAADGAGRAAHQAPAQA